MSSYFSDIFKKITPVLSTSAASTPIPGLQPDPEEAGRGTMKGKAVSIFVPVNVAHVRRVRTLKHPNCISYVTDSMSNSANGDNSVWLVTEPVAAMDISLVRKHQDWRSLLAWQLACVVRFLNGQAGVVHSRLSDPSSYYTDDLGMLRIGAFDRSASLPDGQGDDEGQAIAFINDVLGVSVKSRRMNDVVEELSMNRLVQLVTRLDSISIDQEIDRMATIRTSAAYLNANPDLPCPLIFKILSNIYMLVEQQLEAVNLDIIKVLIDGLSKVLRGNVHLTKNQSARSLEIFGQLLKFPDRAVKLHVLESVDKISVPDAFLTETLYPALISSCTDQLATIRDAALKALVTIAPRLTPKQLSGDLLKHLGRLQDDPQAGIRCNVIVGLTKLEGLLPDDVKIKVVGPAFCRGLSDQFAPTKHASLAGLIQSYRYCGKEEIAQRLIPAIAPLLIDADPDISGKAMTLLDLFIGKISNSKGLNEKGSPSEVMGDRVNAVIPGKSPLTADIPETPTVSSPGEASKPEASRGSLLCKLERGGRSGLGATRKLQ